MLLPPAAAQPAKIAASPAAEPAASAPAETADGQSFQQVLKSEMAGKPDGSASTEASTEASASAAEPPAEPAATAQPPDLAALLALNVGPDATANFVALRSAVRVDAGEVPDDPASDANLIAALDNAASETQGPGKALPGQLSAVEDRAAPKAGAAEEDISFAAIVGAIESESDDRKPIKLASASAIDSDAPVTRIATPSNPDATAAAASVQNKSTDPSVAKPAIALPLSAPGWNNALADNVTVLVQGRHPTAELQINPPNLGPVDIKVSIQGDQATVSFFSAHAPVREAIQAAVPRLTEALAEAGIGLGNVFVGSDARSNDRQAPEREGRGSGRSREIAGIGEVRGAGEVLWNGPVSGMRAVDLFA
jgi:flagellar hook-length control protein FliK